MHVHTTCSRRALLKNWRTDLYPPAFNEADTFSITSGGEGGGDNFHSQQILHHDFQRESCDLVLLRTQILFRNSRRAASRFCGKAAANAFCMDPQMLWRSAGRSRLAPATPRCLLTESEEPQGMPATAHSRRLCLTPASPTSARTPHAGPSFLSPDLVLLHPRLLVPDRKVARAHHACLHAGAKGSTFVLLLVRVRARSLNQLPALGSVRLPNYDAWLRCRS